MKILVINVSLRPYSKEKLFPVGLGYITTSLKNAGFGFDLFDIDLHRYSNKEVEDYLEKHQYDVVCIGCIVTGYKAVKEISGLIRKYHPQTKIIIGNSVATSIPNILLSRTAADIAVMGEGDETIVELLNAIEGSKPLEEVEGIAFVKGKEIIVTPRRKPIKDISLLAPIDFSIFDIEGYIQQSKVSAADPLPIPRQDVRALPVNIARGCIANCGFCYHIFKGIPYRYRSSNSIIEEISSLIDRYKLNYIFFWDELTFFTKRQSLEFVDKVIEKKLKFYWTGSCRCDLFNDDGDIEIIEKMKQAGCTGMLYSLESSDPEILKSMNKHITVDQFSKQTQLFHKAGLTVWTSLVIGYPQETPQTIENTFDCCIKNRIYPSTGYLLPQPGSQMYDYALKNGFIRDEEQYLMKMGDRQDLRINMTSMSDTELTDCVVKGLEKCNRELNMGLKEEQLIKTQYFRAKK